MRDSGDPADDGWDGSGDPGHSDVLDPHLWHTRIKMPEEQRRMGFDARTEEGALLEFASSLSSARAGHRAVAWILIAVFAVPAVMSLLHLLGVLHDGLR